MGDGETRISQRAVPMISYEDAAAAVGWLARALGFCERGVRYPDEEGRTTHAELELDGAAVMLGWPGPDYQDPARHAQTCEAARSWSATPFVADGVLVYVHDVDGLARRARSEGAAIIREHEDQEYGRFHVAQDPSVHRWMIIQTRGS